MALAIASSTGSKRPQFFRVLIPNPFVKLHIPQKFMKHLDGHRHNKATLLSPLGKFWDIDLHQEGDNLYLDGGWSDFAKAHDLLTGYFVVFRYEGNMIFTVKVFDGTCCLKEYELASCENPGCSRTRTGSESSEVECLTLSRSLEHEDEVQFNRTPSSKKRKSERTTSPPTAPSKKTQKTSSSSATPPIRKTQKTAPSPGAPPTNKTENASYSSATTPIKITQKGPQFEKKVRPCSTNYLSFPKSFCIRHGLLSREIVILKNLEGKSYDVRLYNRPTEVRVGKGWQKFALESGFRDGDACIFKLVARSTMLVTLKKVQSEIVATKDSREIIADNSGGATQHPQFMKIVRPFNIGLGYFTIPRAFCLENGLVSKRNITLEDSDGKKWQVRFLIRDDKAKFQKGWSKFSNAHDLKVGQKCIFTLVGENTFRVIIDKGQAETA
ncbi:transcriptional factor B3 family protein [Rhynchospora pubera]|uniref:Transcriptional factor B3 family protein n=1 Tax=Rhynchospora pubera TaxID=906938 RepID=A0AAV8D5D7_9POAL|nr:transcriptional factor B3 family protein [Rhynchospora pubera]